mmetsp:Transcript_3904/g.10817  ORF Transcript_3904/g.10817 Transcript_3904/m.10817 type:complete len:247 (-) Transcript_3904:567-1307(-)
MFGDGIPLRDRGVELSVLGDCGMGIPVPVLAERGVATDRDTDPGELGVDIGFLMLSSHPCSSPWTSSVSSLTWCTSNIVSSACKLSTSPLCDVGPSATSVFCESAPAPWTTPLCTPVPSSATVSGSSPSLSRAALASASCSGSISVVLFLASDCAAFANKLMSSSSVSANPLCMLTGCSTPCDVSSCDVASATAGTSSRSALVTGSDGASCDVSSAAAGTTSLSALVTGSNEASCDVASAAAGTML